ncbi:helix-turn-helix transcriptional regulator [Aeromonas sp. MrichA-1]|uniref:helix-turn-helix domain-containing protein n=1 Tax=Aeromonas sp. MrichA-1 TaxID=2823362 RepID=UPI001B33E938|nr:helix-turn-helix transcriptional regulator [Aeromonas sp. MrichA-1]MBP4081762.1 helix-turn-helix transcriptional regulator [Aeromonas sp. MrichA-1]
MSITLLDLALKELGISQKELAKKIWVSPSAISRWRRSGIIPVESKDYLIDLIGIHPSDEHLARFFHGVQNAERWKSIIFFLIYQSMNNDWKSSLKQSDFTDTVMSSGRLLSKIVEEGASSGLTFDPVMDSSLANLADLLEYGEQGGDDEALNVIDGNCQARFIRKVIETMADHYFFYRMVIVPYLTSCRFRFDDDGYASFSGCFEDLMFDASFYTVLCEYGFCGSYRLDSRIKAAGSIGKINSMLKELREYLDDRKIEVKLDFQKCFGYKPSKQLVEIAKKEFFPE